MYLNQKNFDYFIKTLLAWYEENGRVLPWRKKNITAYEVWVSEVMLQQTQVERVKGFYKNFLKRFPSVSSLADTSWEEFLPYYQGLGYYRRGENMLKTAKIVSGDFRGRFPKTKKELMKLPGIGEYTASAILAFAYDESVLAKDTNIKRVFSRYFGSATVSEEKTMEQFEEFLKNSCYSGREVNSALMDFGSLLCTSNPKKDDHICPFGNGCHCFQNVSTRKSLGSSTPKLERFPGKQAKAYVFLHKNHHEYYSENKKTYKPFLLSKGKTSREQIKKYFLERYGLMLSVRPPFRKMHLSGEPFLFINAQILSGTNPFYVHSKSAVIEYQEKHKK